LIFRNNFGHDYYTERPASSKTKGRMNKSMDMKVNMIREAHKLN
jgi:hypothetical protein